MDASISMEPSTLRDNTIGMVQGREMGKDSWKKKGREGEGERGGEGETETERDHHRVLCTRYQGRAKV